MSGLAAMSSEPVEGTAQTGAQRRKNHVIVVGTLHACTYQKDNCEPMEMKDHI